MEREAESGKRRGGQTIRTRELDERIVAWIADGQTLSSFCDQAGTPATRTVERWKDEDEAFKAAYARAREIGGSVIADRMRDEARAPLSTTDAKLVNAEVMHRRLILDTDKWLLARWFPTQYGERVSIAGTEGAPLVQISNQDAAREVAMLLATAAARKVIADREIVAKALIEEDTGNGDD